MHITLVVTKEFCSKLYLVNCVRNHYAYHISCDEGILWSDEKHCSNVLFNFTPNGRSVFLKSPLHFKYIKSTTLEEIDRVPRRKIYCENVISLLVNLKVELHLFRVYNLILFPV